MFSLLFHALLDGRAGIPWYITPSLQGGRDFAGIPRPPAKSKRGGGITLVFHALPSGIGWLVGWVVGLVGLVGGWVGCVVNALICGGRNLEALVVISVSKLLYLLINFWNK